MIMHDDTILLVTPDAPVIFASLMGISISICAPDTMTAAEIERFANEHGPRPDMGQWVVIDKSKLGLGQPTPNPCNQVAGRKHWFLLDDHAEIFTR